MQISVSISLDKRRLKQTTNAYPVKLMLNIDGITYRYQTLYDLSQEDWDKLQAPRISGKLQTIKDDLKLIQKDAQTYLDKKSSFSIDEFERDFIKGNPLFIPRKRKRKTAPELATAPSFDLSGYKEKLTILNETHPGEDHLSSVYVSYIMKLLEGEQVGSALNYQDSYNSLKKFGGNARLCEITPGYLKRYEKWMLNRGRSKSTVGIKLRPLRAVINYAIDGLKIFKRDSYPFGRYKYLIPASKNTKKSLAMEVIGKLYYYKPQCEEERKAKDFWLFIYFGGGMNPKDMAYLKYKSFAGEYLVFERAKTINTRRADSKPITVFITEEMHEIINTWGNKDKKPNNYIFPVLNDEMTTLEKHFAVKALVKSILDGINKIMPNLGINERVGAMQARHSCATQLKRSGASTEFIQELLGHADKKTTENYLDSFENEVKKEFAAKLAPFKTGSNSTTSLYAVK